MAGKKPAAKAKPVAKTAARPRASLKHRAYLGTGAERKLPLPLLAAAIASAVYGLSKLANALASIWADKTFLSTPYTVSFAGSAAFTVLFLTLATLLWKQKKAAYVFGLVLSGVTLFLEALFFMYLPMLLPLVGLAPAGTMLQTFYLATIAGIIAQAVILFGTHYSKKLLVN